MSVYYGLFLEGMLEGRWVCLDSFVKKPDGEMVHRPLTSGYSVIRELLNDIGYSAIGLETLSPEVRKQFGELDVNTMYGPSCYCFDPEEIRVPEGKYEYERYVLREDMNAFENETLDDIEHWLTEAEYGALDAEEKRMYTFYRWDSPGSTFAIKRRLTEKVKDAVD